MMHMTRRRFLTSSAWRGATTVTPALSAATVDGAAGGQAQAPAKTATRPHRILMGGYGPASTGFSLALKKIGDRVASAFPGQVDVKYVYNILDLGYRGEDILW